MSKVITYKKVVLSFYR